MQPASDVYFPTSDALALKLVSCTFRDLLKGSVSQDQLLLEDAEIKGYIEDYATDQVPVLPAHHGSCLIHDDPID